MNRRYRCLMVGLMFLCANCAQAGQKMKWIRRFTAIGACAASVTDISSTRRAVQLGAVEARSIFADESGRPRWNRMIAINLGYCLGPAIIQETKIFGPRWDPVWIGTNSAQIAWHGWATVHNYSVADSLRKH